MTKKIFLIFLVSVFFIFSVYCEEQKDDDLRHIWVSIREIDEDKAYEGYDLNIDYVNALNDSKKSKNFHSEVELSRYKNGSVQTAKPYSITELAKEIGVNLEDLKSALDSCDYDIDVFNFLSDAENRDISKILLENKENRDAFFSNYSKNKEELTKETNDDVQIEDVINQYYTETSDREVKDGGKPLIFSDNLLTKKNKNDNKIEQVIIIDPETEDITKKNITYTAEEKEPEIVDNPFILVEGEEDSTKENSGFVLPPSLPNKNDFQQSENGKVSIFFNEQNEVPSFFTEPSSDSKQKTNTSLTIQGNEKEVNEKSKETKTEKKNINYVVEKNEKKATVNEKTETNVQREKVITEYVPIEVKEEKTEVELEEYDTSTFNEVINANATIKEDETVMHRIWSYIKEKVILCIVSFIVVLAIGIGSTVLWHRTSENGVYELQSKKTMAQEIEGTRQNIVIKENDSEESGSKNE